MSDRLDRDRLKAALFEGDDCEPIGNGRVSVSRNVHNVLWNAADLLLEFPTRQQIQAAAQAIADDRAEGEPNEEHVSDALAALDAVRDEIFGGEL